MKFIIENLTKEPSFLELSQAAKDLKYEVQDIRGDYRKSDIAHYQNEQVIFNGCIEMCSLVGDQLKDQGCTPGVLCNFENYLCTKYYSHLSGFLFNDNYVMVPFIELLTRRFFFYGLFGKEAVIFVRPDSGEKTFKAGLFDLQDLDSFSSQFEDHWNDLVIISSPKNIRGEWRFLVNDRQEIIAQSSYRYQGLLTKVPYAPPKATELCKEILKLGYYPDKLFCIDICEDNDGNFWVMELTSFSSAGLYAMDKYKVIQGVVNYFK